jgi:hypothetical protein
LTAALEGDDDDVAEKILAEVEGREEEKQRYARPEKDKLLPAFRAVF